MNYPLVGEPELKVARAYDMLPEDAGSAAQGRTAADDQTVRKERYPAGWKVPRPYLRIVPQPK